jgi:hypothetical protein
MSKDFDPEFAERPESPDHPEVGERPNPELNNQRINPLLLKRRDPIFYVGIAIAAICIIGAISVTSFIAGSIAANALNKGNASDFATLKSQMQNKQERYKERPPMGEVVGKIAILKKENGFQFSQPVFKMPAGVGIAWINQTDQVQIVMADNGGPSIKIAPGEVNTMFLKEGNKTYVLRLSANSNASVTIYVGANQ